jgi:serine/threonine protein kinase
MSDFTQQQTDEQQRDAQELSLKRTQPPGHAPGYRTEEFIGAGAFGEVWRAVDGNTGRQVAIKFFTHRGRVDWSLLRREVEKLVFLAADRYVVQLLDVGWDADPPYYVMDYIPEGLARGISRGWPRHARA